MTRSSSIMEEYLPTAAGGGQSDALLKPNKRGKRSCRCENIQRKIDNLHKSVAELNSLLETASQTVYRGAAFRHLTLLEFSDWNAHPAAGGMLPLSELRAAKVSINITTPSQPTATQDAQIVSNCLLGPTATAAATALQQVDHRNHVNMAVCTTPQEVEENVQARKRNRTKRRLESRRDDDDLIVARKLLEVRSCDQLSCVIADLDEAPNAVDTESPHDHDYESSEENSVSTCPNVA
eukprot:scaffold829_cov174-Ochromonas_danica.AAC.2